MPLKKLCNKCKQEKESSLFYANKRMKDGLNTFCIACHKQDNIARKAKNRQDPSFKQQEKEYRKAYIDTNRDFCNELTRQWREENRAYIAKYAKAYRAKNKARCAYWGQKRLADKIQRTPKWLTDDDWWLIEEMYALATLRTNVTGVKWHVDHIIPLRGKFVSGLHTPANLQVITQAANQRKSNFYEV